MLAAMLLLLPPPPPPPPPLPCNRPDDGVDGDSVEWTGEKMRKHLDPSLPSDTGEVADARISPSSSDAPEERVPDQEDPIINEKKFLDQLLKYEDLFSKRRPKILVGCGELDLGPQREVYKRLVRYRMRAHKLLKGNCKVTLCDELPGFLKQAVSLDDLRISVDIYFLHLDEEEDDTIDWYFDSHSKFEDDSQSKFKDYHRLLLYNHLPTEVFVYQDWEHYSSLFTTYEMDKDYVNFVEEISGQLNWLKSGVGYPETSDVWKHMHYRGALQALKIAEKYTHMNYVLACTAYREYIWSLRFDYLYHKDKDGLLFEIWKHITKGQLTFEAALVQLLRHNLFPQRKNLIERALQKEIWCGLEEEYNSCVEGIPVNASEDDAKALIGAAVLKLHKGKKPLHQYMERKMQIAKSIGLVKTGFHFQLHKT